MIYLSGAVKIPMMPKGVEHFRALVAGDIPSHVKIPMMPKGVEHVSGIVSCWTGFQ